MKSLFLAASVAALLAAAPVMAQTASPGAPAPNYPNATRTAPGGASHDMRGTGEAREHAGANASGEHRADTRFIEHMARDGRAEVEIGKLAEQKSSNPDVKAFAQRLVQDHGQANQQLMQIAQQQGVQPPKGVGKDKSELHAKLEKLSGNAFDREFVQSQIKDHEKDVQYLQREEGQLQDPQLKSFAQQTLPVLQQHLQMAQQLASEEGIGSSRQGRSNQQQGSTTRHGG